MKTKTLIPVIVLMVLSFCCINTSHAADASTYVDIYNNDVYPKATFKKAIDAPFVMKNEVSENIDTATGDLSIRHTDLYLKGKNGLDFSLTRYYSLSNAIRQKPEVSLDDHGGRYEYAAPILRWSPIPIGFSWMFDLPYIEIKPYGDYNYLHLSGGGSLRFTDNGYNCSFYDPTQIILLQDRDYKSTPGYEYSNGWDRAKYILPQSDGKAFYFNENGLLIGIKDRFKNEIKFFYTGGKLSKIIDSLDREINISYLSTENQVIITVNDNNGNITKKITFNLTNVTGSQELGSVVDSEKRVTTYQYDTKSAIASLLYDPIYPGVTINVDCLSKIIYPTGGETRYSYSKYTKNLGNDGYTQFYKVASRLDYKKDSTIQNYKKYIYGLGDSLETDGYPKYKKAFDIPDGYLVKTKILDVLNNSDQYNVLDTHKYFKRFTTWQDSTPKDNFSYVKLFQKNIDTITSKSQETYYYSYDYISKKILLNYNKQSDKFTTKVEDFAYDSFGNLLNYWGPQASRDSNFNLTNPDNDEHLTKYLYSTTFFNKRYYPKEASWGPYYYYSSSASVYFNFDTYYNFYKALEQKIYKTSSGKTIKEVYSPTEDYMNARWAKTYENDVLKQQNWYDYDTYGNFKEKRSYLDDWTTYITEKYSYDDNEPTRNGKFNGGYLTQKSTEGVKDADDKLIGTISESYKYDWCGNLVEKKDGKGNPTTYQYDKLNRLTNITNPDQTFKSIAYNDLENTVIHTDERNNSIKYGYDELGNIAYEQNVSTGEFLNHYEYDAKGSLSGEYNSDKKSIKYYYNNDGRANRKEVKEQYVWFENSLPPSSTLTTSNDEWAWKYDKLGDVSQYHVSKNAIGQHQHAFENTLRKMNINAGDYLYVNVYIPSGAVPSELMIQWKENGSWEHRAYWGANSISIGTDGTASRKYIATLPATNTWTTLVIPASSVGLEGKTVDGMAFTLFDGQAYWGSVGLYRGSSTPKTLSCESYTYDDANYTDGKYLLKFTKTIQGDANSKAIITSSYFDVSNQLVKQEKTHVEDSETKTYKDTFEYDYLGNKTSEKSARAYDEGWSEAYTAKTEYNFAGKPTNVYNAKGDYTTTTYDALGRVTSVTDIKGNKASPKYSTIYTYDSLGRVLTEKIPFQTIGTTTYYTTKKHYYDNNGNIVKEKITVNKPGETDKFAQTDYEYNSRNMLTKVTTYNNDIPENYTQYYYDEVGNKVRMYTGLKTPLTITGLDKVTPGTDTVYSTNKYTYNELNKISTFVDPLLNAEYYYYDSNGNLINKYISNGNRTDYEYDGLNRVIKSESKTPDGLGNLCYSYTYDCSGNVSSISGGKEYIANPSFYSNTSGWTFYTDSSAVATGARDVTEYDSSPAGFRVDCTTKSTSQSAIQFFTSGTGVRIKAGMSYKLRFMAKSTGGTITPNIQLMQMSSPYTNYASTQTVSIGPAWQAYTLTFTPNTTDPCARITFFLGDKMPNGSKLYLDSISFQDATPEAYTSNTYDDLGRLVSQSVVSGINGIYKSFTYDAGNNRKSMVIKNDASNILSEISYVYDNLNRLSNVSDSGRLAATYMYDDNSNRETMVYPNGNSVAYQYNLQNKVTQLTNKNGTTLLSNYAYTYYTNGNQESVTDSVAGKASKYTYDDLGRLNTVVDVGNSNTLYTYDESNNRKTMSITDAVYKQQTSYDFDLDNRLVTEITTGKINEITKYSYDYNGNQTKKINGDIAYKYNYSQNLTMTYHGFDIPVDINSDYIYSFDAYISEDANIASTGTTHIASGENGFSTKLYYDNTKKGTWQHFEVTKRPSTSTARILLYPTWTSTPATSGYIIYKNVSYKKVGGTENLFTQPLNNSDFKIKGAGTMTVEAEGDKVYRYDYSQNLTMTYHGFDIPVDINSEYTYSFDAFVSNGTDVSNTGTTFIASGENGFSKTFYYDNTKKGTWQHFEVSKRPSTSTARILLYPTGASTPSTGYILYKNVNFKKVGTTVNLFTQPVDNSGFTVRGNGIITKDIAKTYNYRYDGLNRLTSTNEDISLGYSYNADGLRISKTANGNTINYVWDGDQIVLELDGTGVAKNRYVRGINLIYAEDGAGANRKYYLFNGHGDVVQLTNTEGDVVKNYNYDSFGNEISAKKDCKDSFVDGIAYGWENYGGTWKVENGEYSVNISNGAKSLMSGVSGSDYTIEADVKLLGSSGDAGLAFRVSNPSVGGDSFNGYYVGLNIQTGNIVLGKMDGNWSVITQVPFTVNSNVSYHLKVVANGSNIKIYVNGILKINVNDTTYTSGGIGVRAHYSNTHFDNIVVTGATYTDNDQNAFRYCGEYFDKETGTIYLRARYYNPGTGRFISEDSVRGKDNDPLSLNLYTYCVNNPLNFIDPSGHETGPVNGFVNDYDGSVKYGKEQYGWYLTFTYPDKSVRNELHMGTTAPTYYLPKGTNVVRTPLYRNYADVTVGDYSHRFYGYDKSNFSNFKMDRVSFIKAMDIPYYEYRFNDKYHNSMNPFEDPLHNTNFINGVITGITFAYGGALCKELGILDKIPKIIKGSAPITVPVVENFISTPITLVPGTYSKDLIYIHPQNSIDWDYCTYIEVAPNGDPNKPSVVTENNDIWGGIQ